MSDPKNPLNSSDYLLDDEQFVALIESEYHKLGKPVDEVSKERNWQKITQNIPPLVAKTRQHSRFKIYPWLSLAALAAVIFIALPFISTENITNKGGTPTSDSIAMSLKDHSLVITAVQVQEIAVLGQMLDKPRILWKGTISEEKLTVPLPQGIQKSCLITASSLEILERKITLAIENWEHLELHHCLEFNP